jgi:ribosomal protein L19
VLSLQAKYRWGRRDLRGVHVRVEEVKESLLDLFEIVVIANRNDALANALYHLRKVFKVFAFLCGQ